MPNRVLGIDPGYGRVGIAVMEKIGGNEKLIHSECFETNSKIPHEERLLLVANRVAEIISEFQPKIMAVETILFSKNQKTALLVAEAKGAILLEAARKKIRIKELNPNQIKLAVTGYGKSDKKQIIRMIERILKLNYSKKQDDEYDAIAVALTCLVATLSTDDF